jgi:hypothetical protein
MEREPIFNFEHDTVKPEVKQEKDSDENKEKKEKKRKPRLWDREGRQAERAHREADASKLKKTGEGVLGLAGKEKEDKASAPSTDTKIAEQPKDPHTFELPFDEAASESMYERPELKTTLSESTVTETNDDEITDAEMVDEGTSKSDAPEVAVTESKDIVDAVVIETPEDEKPEQPSVVPATTASTAPFVFARTRAQQPNGGSGGGTVPPQGPGTPPPGGGPRSSGNTPPPHYFHAESTAPNFNTVPIPIATKLDTDPFAYRRGKKRGFAQGLVTGAAGGWLMGRRSERKKAAAAERRHQQVAEQQRAQIKHLEFERSRSQETVSPIAQPEHAKPEVAEKPKSAETTPLKTREALITAAAEQAAKMTVLVEKPAVEIQPIIPSQRVEQQIATQEADSKFREDAAKSSIGRKTKVD